MRLTMREIFNKEKINFNKVVRKKRNMYKLQKYNRLYIRKWYPTAVLNLILKLSKLENRKATNH